MKHRTQLLGVLLPLSPFALALSCEQTPLQARIEFPDPFYAAAVSPDGSTVLGPTDRVWKNGAIVPLADPLPGRALSASNGGGVIVGAADPSSAFPFRWDHGVVVPLSPHQGTARAVTPDGAIAVGYDFLRGGLMWVGDEAIEIAGFDAVTSISADGETFVEWSDQGARLVSRAGQVDEIPPLLTRADYPHDPIVSGDGSTVVHSDLGEDGINGPRHPFRWRDGGFELLDYGDGVPLPEFGSVAYAVSHNGELIAGCSDYAETSPYGLVERAFVWDAAHGVRASSRCWSSSARAFRKATSSDA